MSASSGTPWILRTRPVAAPELRLFCFPYSGGGASAFFPWRDQLIPGVELCPVELPGRGRRVTEPAFTRIEPLVEAVADGLRPLLDRPYVLFGHSMGALVAFELARRLRALGERSPALLVASGHVAPHRARREQPIHTLPEPEFLERLRQLDGTPAEVLENRELREIVLPILRADFSICDHYGYADADPLGCPITAFGGLEDAEVPREDLDAWRACTREAFTLRMFPGGHFFLHTSRALVLRALAGELHRLTQSATRP